VKRLSGTGNYVVVKADPNNNSYQPADPGPARTSFGTWADAGDWVVHHPNNYSGQPSEITIKKSPTNAYVPCGSFGCGNGLPGIRGMWANSGESFQMFYDLNQMKASYPDLANFSSNFTFSINYNGTDVVIQNLALPVVNTTQGLVYTTIQAAINAANPADVIEVAAGTYNEVITINKSLTLKGPNAGISGYASRVSEAQVRDGKLTISGNIDVTIDGMQFYTTVNTHQDLILINTLDATVTIKNNRIERFATSTGDVVRGIATALGITTPVLIENNLFTGDISGGLFSGHKTLNNGIFCNGGSNITIKGNKFDNVRTALNVDNMSAGVTIENNIFETNGSALAFGGTTPTSGSYTLNGNSFKIINTIANLSNVATSFRLNLIGNTFDGKASSDLNLEESFGIERTLFHRGRSSRNGAVTFVPNTQFVVVQNPSIQNAVTYSENGGIVHVEAGTYTGGININKSLHLKGANAGMPAADGTGVNPSVRGLETIMTSGGPAVFTPAASNITIDGFKFTGGNGRLIDTYANSDTLTITNNVFDIPSGAADGGVIQMGGGSKAGLTITNNSFQGVGTSNWLYLSGSNASNVVIEGNDFLGTNRSIFLAGGIGYENTLIKGNYFGSNTNTGINMNGLIAPVIENNTFKVTYAAMQIGANGGFIRNNTIDGVNQVGIDFSNFPGFGVQAWGLTLWANSQNLRISGNTISGIINPAEEPGELDFFAAIGLGATYGPGIVIENNILEGNSLGIRMNTDQSGSIGITGNAIVNNTLGILNQKATPVTATCNWWGTVNANTIQSNIVGDVNFSPYLVSGTDSEPLTPGFQPASSTCTGTPVVITSAIPTPEICGVLGIIEVSVEDGEHPYDIAWTGGSANGISSPYTIANLNGGTYGITVTDANGSTASTSVVVQYLPVHNTTANTHHATIQAAVNAASANDILVVCAGTYNEQVQLGSMALSLRGANYGISGDGERGPESIITGHTFGFFLNASQNVIIDGFSIVGTGLSASRGIILGNTSITPGPVTLSNNIISGTWTTGLSLAGGATPGWVSNVTITGNKFQNNGIGSTENATNLTIQNNTFVGAGIGLGSGATMAATISGNNFSGATGSGRYVSIASGVTLFAGQDLDGILAANTFDKYAAVFAATGSWYNQAVFANITSAIAAAATDAIIKISANTFNEDVTVNKAVDLRGANYGLCYNDEDREVIETTIAGLVTVSAAGASLDGFRLTKRENSTTLNGINFSNWSGVSLNVTGINTGIRNNIIEMYGGAGGTDNAVILNAGGAVTFECNEVIAGDGYAAEADERGVSALRLTNASSNYNVSGNRFAVSSGRDSGGDADAVSFFNVGDASFDGNLVEGNIMGGVVMFGGLGEISITNNTINNYTSALAGIRVVNCCGYNSDDAQVTITGNFVQGSSGTTGIKIDAPAGDIVNLSSNSITGNDTAIEHTADNGTLNATCNWFGTTNKATIAAALDGSITFEPFLGSGVDDDEDVPGFQPVIGDQPGYVSAVTGNSQPISNGSTTISATNLTLMGSAPVGGSIIRNYTFTAATSCGANNGAEFTSLTFEGDASTRFSFGGVAIDTEYAPDTYNFTISYQAHTVEITDDVTVVMTTSSGEYRFNLRAVTIVPVAIPAVAEIRGNNVVITNGSFSPNTSNHTDFGTLNQAGTIQRTFTITNAGASGAENLTVGAITISGAQQDKFEVTTNGCDNASLASGQSCTFTVTYTSGNTGGISNATIAVANSDAARDPYEFAIRAQLLVPTLSMTGNNQTILNGSTTTSTSNHTMMGTLLVGQNITRTFSFQGSGGGSFSVGENAVSISVYEGNPGGTNNFVVTQQPAVGVYGPNQSGSFNIRFTSTGQDNFFALVTFTTSIGNFTYVVEGRTPLPRMRVERNSNNEIENGAITVDPDNHTDFGTRGINSSLTRIFTVRNPSALGAASTLLLNGAPRAQVIAGHGAEMFSVTVQPGSSIGVNGSTQFRIRYLPTAAGCHWARISIPSNDPARNPYTFVVRGNTAGQGCAGEYPGGHAMGLPDNIEWIAIDADEDVEELSVYPNPANQAIWIESPYRTDMYTLYVIQFDGRVIETIRTFGGTEQLNISHYIPGIYILRSSDPEMKPLRFVKM
jgi:hypothetical protein